MTVVSAGGNVTPWFATTQLTSPELRYAMATLLGGDISSPINVEGGVRPSGGDTNGAFVPTSNGSASNPSVSVAPGQCVIKRSVGGTYICTMTAATTVALDLPLPAAGQTRIDLLVAQVVDPEADSAATTGTTFQLRTVLGTASASPVAPSVPADTLPLFKWTVNNAGAITAITSIRTYTRALGGVRLVDDGDTRAGSHPGDLRMRANGQLEVWKNGIWNILASPASWTQFTPQLFASVTGLIPLGTGGSAIGRYMIQGKSMHLRYIFRADTQTNGFNGGDGNISTRLPPGVTSAVSEETQILAKLNMASANGPLASIFLGKAFIPPNSTMMNLYFPVDWSRSDLHTYMISNGGAAGSGFPFLTGDYPRPLILVIQGTIEIQ